VAVLDLDWISESIILNYRIGYGVYEKITDRIRLKNFHIRTPLVQCSTKKVAQAVVKMMIQEKGLAQ